MPTPDETRRVQEIGEQLRGKIASKFQTTTFMAGICFAVLGIQISFLWQAATTPNLLPVALSTMV